MSATTVSSPESRDGVGASTAVARPTRLDAFMAEILPPEKAQDVYAALPQHISPARFARNLANALMREPKLFNCDPRVVYREVSKLAALGLLLDPQLGEAYLIVDRNNDVQARVGYRGLIKLARQSGEIANIFAHDICRNDEVEISLGTDKRLRHTPNALGDRGDVAAYYAVVEFSSGAKDFEVMSLAEIHKIRDRSDAWRAFSSGKIKSTPWSADEGEMSKKTVLRRLCKRIPMSPEHADLLADLLAREDESEHRGGGRDALPAGGGLAARLLAKKNDQPMPGFDAHGVDRELETIDAETGEVVERRQERRTEPERRDETTDRRDDRARMTVEQAEAAGEAAGLKGSGPRALPAELREGNDELREAWLRGNKHGLAKKDEEKL